MEDQLISFETAKLAKEKGFWGIFLLYKKDGTTWNSCFLGEDEFKECYPAPTQSLLQKWLREKHNFHIEIKSNSHSQGNQGLWEYLTTPIFEKGHILNYLDTSKRQGNGCGLNTYEDCLEEALMVALKLI